MKKRSVLIGLVTAKLLFDIVILIIIIILILNAILAIANLAIFEDKKYLSLVTNIEKVMDDCIKRRQCEERVWLEDFSYNPIVYSIYFNYTEGRIYLIKCDEPEGKMYFEANGEDLYRIFGQNCKILKRTKPILTSDTKVIIESKNKNIGIYTLKAIVENTIQFSSINVHSSNDLYKFNGGIGDIGEGPSSRCVIRIKETNNKFEINKDSIRKDLGSFLFGEISKIRTNTYIKDLNTLTCSNVLYEIDSKQDLLEKGILISPPMQVIVIPLNKEIRFIIPEG